MDYPSQLPKALQRGHSVELVSPLMRTDLASGRARQRQVFDNVPLNVSVTWIFTSGEAQLFEGWFRYGISNGADWHTMPVRTPMGCRDETVRFIGRYQGPEMIGPNLWRYSADIEIFERTTVSEDDLEFPDYIVGASILDVAMNELWP